ncbi:pilus assembly protein N-terminal domain-containing protein [Aestuariivirga sp.]|jgi:hypothetical protein|uniref:pilus assembly protein N-terminal domain-containing protein n=1 Tax=Aestuariivirga sp. TaxID=2650926 RepID=UPI003784306C
MIKYFGILVFATSMGLCATGQSLAGSERLALVADQSRIINLAAVPATVVVGNPSIADATMDGRSLFLHARGPGLTNITVLDARGETVADYLIHVVYADDQGMALYTPDGRFSFACVNDCEPVMRVGDNSEQFQDYSTQLITKTGLATSQALGEDLLLARTPQTGGSP